MPPGTPKVTTRGVSSSSGRSRSRVVHLRSTVYRDEDLEGKNFSPEDEVEATRPLYFLKMMEAPSLFLQEKRVAVDLRLLQS